MMVRSSSQRRDISRAPSRCRAYPSTRGGVRDREAAFPYRATIWRDAELLTTSDTSDLALLLVPASPRDSITVAPFALEPIAQSGSVVGAAYGKSWSVSPYRYVSADTAGSFLIDCATCGPGDSGGGAFDARGRLAGMLVSEQRVIERGRSASALRTMRFRAIAVSAIRSLLQASRRISAPRIAPPLIDPWSRFPPPQTH
jgi:hypothetical protein